VVYFELFWSGEDRPLTPGEVDWTRVGEPQQDGYDTEIALALAEREFNWQRPPPPAPPHAFDGRVALRTWRPNIPIDPLLRPASFEHPNLRWAEACLKSVWPVVHRQFAELVAELAPLDLREPTSDDVIGSYSSHSPTPPFAIYTTCFDAFGAAESMVHEMAHVKLRCLGVQVDSSSRLIVNPQSELFRSPLRAYPRPMTAVVHAFYSWLHITELDTRWADIDPQRARMRMARNCDWIETMAQEILAHVRTDEAGARFLPPLFTWAGRLLKRGRALLQADAKAAPVTEGVA
jgi:HEXXH motif-containing protein